LPGLLLAALSWLLLAALSRLLALLARLLLSAAALLSALATLLSALVLLAGLLIRVLVHNCSSVSSLATTKPRPLSFLRMLVRKRTFASRNLSAPISLGGKLIGGDHGSVYVVFGSFDQMTGAVQFIVLKRDDKWVVKSGDLERVFLAKRDAVAAAIRFANDSGKEGRPSVVLLQKSKADFQSIWMYGQSPYPPTKSDLSATSATSKPRKLAHTLS
jgi:hypothetical protein